MGTDETETAEAPESLVFAGEPGRALLRHLAPLAAAVGVFVVYRLVYVVAAIDSVKLPVSAFVEAPATADLATSTQDLLTRLTWGGTALVYTVAWIVSLGVVFEVIRQSVADRSRQFRRGLLGAAVVLVGAAVAQGLAGNPLTVPAVLPVLDQTFERLDMTDGSLVLHLFNGFNIATAVLLILGASATLAFPVSDSQGMDDLRAQMHRLRRVLYAGAAVLVTGVIQTTAMHRLPIPLLGDDGESLQQVAGGLAVAMGTLGTLFLLAIYLPAAQILRTRAMKLAAGATGVRQPSKLEGWLRERGMESSLPQQLSRLTAVLAPFLAGGPLMAALKLLGG